MFRIALIGTISAVLLLAAGTIASAEGISPFNSNGHKFGVVSQVGRMASGQTTTTSDGTTTAGSSETMASHIAYVTEQMRAHNAQMETATHMQPSNGTGTGYGMQSGSMGTGTGYMGTSNMGPNMGTTGTGMGTNTAQMGGGGSMMGR